VHQVGLKNPGSQNFRTLTSKEEAVDVTQIYPTTATLAIFLIYGSKNGSNEGSGKNI
jgi:hypothetical protein